MIKKHTLALTVAGMTSTATLALAGQWAGTGINGSAHDMNAVGGYQHDSLERTCVFCHTPHNARTTNTPAPLWNHADGLAYANSYVWVAPANKQIIIDTDPLIGPSRLCMACHDGVTAVDAHGSAASSPVGITAMNASKTASYTDALGSAATRYIKDLTITHPIGFSYDDAYNRRGPQELVHKSNGFLVNAPDPANWDTQHRVDANGTSWATTNKKIQDTLYGDTVNSDGSRSGGYMTCATCHDVHNSVNATPVGNIQKYNYFLYSKEEGSAICLSCHVK